MVNNLLGNGGDAGLIPGLGRSSGDGNGNSLKYSCLEYPMDGGAWRATVHGVAKQSDMTYQLYKNNKVITTTFYISFLIKKNNGSPCLCWA